MEASRTDHFRSHPQPLALNRRPGRNSLITWFRHYPESPNAQKEKKKKITLKKHIKLQRRKGGSYRAQGERHGLSSRLKRTPQGSRDTLAARLPRGAGARPSLRHVGSSILARQEGGLPWCRREERSLGSRVVLLGQEGPLAAHGSLTQRSKMAAASCAAPPPAAGFPVVSPAPPPATPTPRPPGCHVTAARSRGAGFSGAAPQGRSLRSTDGAAVCRSFSPGRLV